MKLSEFNLAVAEEFGSAYARVLVTDFGLEDFAGLTAEQALAAGSPTKEVWLALCAAMSVPEARRHGVGRPVDLKKR